MWYTYIVSRNAYDPPRTITLNGVAQPQKGYAVLGGYFFGTCFRTEITSKGKRHLSRQQVARRSGKSLQKLDQVALVGNQHSKWKVSGRHVNRNIYLDYLPELFQIREEVVRSLKLEGYRNSKLKQVTKTFPVRFQNLVKTFIGVL